VVARDVTEQRRTEERLRNQKNYSRALIESSPDALLATDIRLNITDVNEKTAQLTGYSRQELLRSPLPSLFTDAALAAQAAHKALSELVKDYQLTIRTADGADVPVSFNASQFKDAQGEVRGVFASARDISEHQRLERERSLLASIVTSSEEAIYSETPEGIVNSWNGGAEKLLGYSAQEMIGRNITVCIPLERRVESLEHLRRVLRKEGIQQFQTVRRRKDGSVVDVSITMSPIVDKAGGVSGIALIARDITQRKHFEEELTKARDEALEGARLKSEFLANMSHEIRTPLNSMVGLGGILLDSNLSGEQQSLVRELHDTNEGLLAIINDILDFSKMSVGKLLFEVVDFELEKVIAATLSLLAVRARKKRLEVAMSIEPDTPGILRGDPGRLRQVLANLLSNAVKFTDRGEIVVRASKVSESPSTAMLRFEVRDTGIGIPEQAQGQLFRAFTQVGDRPQEGTGLGLAIARTLVEQMGGSIGVLSAPGTGSTFWFTAKFAKSGSGVAPLAAARGLSLEGLSVLVVDDNETSRAILKSQLGSLKMTVDSLPDAAQAMETLQARARAGRPYSIALLDVEMPGVNGLELAQMIRGTPETATTILILLSSARRSVEDHRIISALNIATCLDKPAAPSELYDALTNALASKLGLPPEAIAGLGSPEVPREVAALELAGAPGRKPHVLLAEDNAGNRKVALWQLDNSAVARTR
jgi:two-component system sensor histidine kinase/response regulator